MGGEAIVIMGRSVTLQQTPISGDVAITAAGVSTIGAGRVTVDMLDSTLVSYLVSVAAVGTAVVGYCKVG